MQPAFRIIFVIPTRSTLERAFDLARSGRFQSVLEIQRQLAKEGYRSEQVEGRSLRRQLKLLIDGARTGAKAAVG